MPETFLILLAGGIMLAAAISDPKQVTLLWLRLCGIIALSLTGLSLFFFAKAEDSARSYTIGRVAIFAYAPLFFFVLCQLAAAQIPWRRAQRVFAFLAFAASIFAADLSFRRVVTGRAYELGAISNIVALAGVAAMTGLVLMDMLLGHAYLTASKMTMKPFARLNGSLAFVAVLRLISATAGVYLLNSMHPVRMLWGVHGLLMLTRWLVGLALPFVFLYMVHDCIKRRATQSATGILYVCGILVFIGEMIALPLVRDTGLPF
jgi:hypothetical protein